MIYRFIKLGTLVVFATWLAACQSLMNLQKPDVALSSINVESVGLFEQQWRVNLRVTNPNEKGLTLNTLDYTLFVQDQKIATGMNKEPISIPARSSEIISTTISTSLFQTLSGLSKTSIGAGGKLPYRIEGVAKLAGWPLPVSFNHQSDISLTAPQ